MTQMPDYSALTQTDLTNCDREPIHQLGRVQSWACLIALSHDWIVQHHSANAARMLGLAAEDLLGLPLADLLPVQTKQLIRAHLTRLSLDQQTVRLFGLEIGRRGVLFDVAAHAYKHGFILEFEIKKSHNHASDLAVVQPLIQKLSTMRDVPQMASSAAESLRRLTGFARVMVYQFSPDGSGKVIAEALAPGMSGYLGLRFPGSDIPKQARALYKRSLLRLIGNVDDAGSEILPAQNPMGEPLDLSLSVSRSVSPIHLEYLRNMGVQASMSVSILNQGELWGLIACHHPEPLIMDYEKRTSVELFGQLFAYELARAETMIENESALRAQETHNRIMALVSATSEWAENFSDIARQIEDLIQFDGIALYSDGKLLTQGTTPTEEQFYRLARYLNTASGSRVYATDHLSKGFPEAATYQEDCAGLLALPISRRPRDYLVLFRREIAKSVTWAGNPEKPVEHGPNGDRLSPRKSFEAWREEVHGHCAPWAAGELRAAEALRGTLLEVVLKLTDQAEKERKQAQERQALLISELNHRVRNILNLIRSIMKQSSSGAETLSEFTVALDGRINALARAHDQLTRDQFAPIPLAELIEVEANAFGLGNKSRLDFRGQNIVITAEAFTPLALVFHELVTNSVKYGALHAPSGRVEIGITEEPDGTWTIDWHERGGPVVRAPTRRGFGSTVIEKTIPHELKGAAEVRYNSAGVEARFSLPANIVITHHPFDGNPEINMQDETSPASGEPWVGGPALVLEDTMIVALDLAGMLEDMGADEVRTAASVAEALSILKDGFVPKLAVLDVNLGEETSLPVAEHLAAQGVPIVLASGYDANEAGIDAYPEAELMRKPYTTGDLSDVLTKMGFLRN
ncbi:HWE histidine kinase domain-containing protein [Thioclava sp. GXIMD4215]|uniref:HWE histidine kinase domain-containing protein n=1 Tax=Thioclava sp. GXIMD4215 TaxID=3131928 RepID=UPI003252A5EF